VIAAVAFYKYDYFPAATRKTCNAESIEEAQAKLKKKSELDSTYHEVAAQGYYMNADYDQAYRQCLRSKGLEL
jgi:hypothetical protein